MPDIVRVNGTIYSWTSTLHKIDNAPWTGIVEVNFEQKRERKIVYDAQPDGRPIGRTSGKYSITGFTIKVLKDSSHALKKYLAGLSADGKSYGDPEWSYFLQISEPQADSEDLNYLVERCTIDGVKDAYAEGIDELVDELEVGALWLTTNDLRLWSGIRSQP